MKIETMLAKKYFYPYNRDFFRRLSIISILTVFISVFLPMLVIGILNGFHQNLIDKIISKDFHIQVTDEKRNLFSDYKDVIQYIEKRHPEVKGFPYFENGAVIVKDLLKTSAVIRGIPENLLDYISEFKIVDGEWRLSETDIAVGYDIARKLRIKAGDIVKLYFKPYAKINEDKSPVLVVKKFKVSAVFSTGYDEIDSNLLFLNFEKAIKIYDFGNRAKGVGFFVKKLEEISSVKKDVRNLDPYLTVKDWEQNHKNILFSFDFEKILMMIVLAIIIILSLFAVYIGLNVVVADKKKEIGILKMMGFTEKKIEIVFFIKGFFISLIGICFGTFFSFLILYNLKDIIFMLERALKFFSVTTEIVSRESSYGSKLYFEWSLLDIIFVFTMNMIAVLLATYFPVKRINSYSIAESVRNG